MARQFAAVILGRVTARNLHLVGLPAGSTSEFDDVREAIRSVSDPLERISFVGDIRYHFHRLREERGHGARGREFVRAVAAAGIIPVERRAA
jgi:hypothetical protein